MATKDEQKWFVKLDIEEASELSMCCPRCQHPYLVSPLFDEEFRQCKNCKVTLAEWNLIRFVYLIDVANSPNIVQVLANHVRSLNSPEGFKQLEILHRFLGFDLFG